jgi:peptide/nickel transport system substrate-binding protein
MKYGGTLRYYGPGEMDHVDPACAYYTFSHQVIRLFSRQLYSYPTTLDHTALEPVADVAAGPPSVSADGRRYVIRLRDGVAWDTTPPRPVTAEDFIRGFKRMCNPVVAAGAIGYYTSTIAGMAEFAEGYRTIGHTAAALAAYQNGHDIAGLRALSGTELEITLIRPANDLLNLLAMPFASAAPAEYDAYLPDSPELIRNLVSNGPYRLERYEPGARLSMGHNPAWRPGADPLRRRYVQRIEVTMAQVPDARVREAIESGAADLSWGAAVISADRTPPDADRHLGYALNPYLVFNLRSPNAGGAMGNLLVRQAIAVAVDKMAVVRLLDGMDVGTVSVPAHTAIPPGNFGHREYDPYPTPGDRGDPERSRALLAAAGYPDGLTLKALYRDDAVHAEIAQSYAKDLERAGIHVELVFVPQTGEYYRLLQDPANGAAGRWDLTAASWTPDWFGNNGRAYLQPMFQTNTAPGTSNYGGYSNAGVDRLIEQALSASDPAEAFELWHRVDRQVLADAAIVPVVACEPTIRHMSSDRVRDAVPMPQIDRWYDAANVWLADQP